MTNKDYKSKLSNQKVAIIGVGGKTGKAVMKFLLEKKSEVVLFDDRSWNELPDIIKLKDKFSSKTIRLAEQKEEIKGVDLVVVSPGVPEHNLLIKEAQSLDIPVISELELAFNFIEANIIAITGTNGKTTTTSLVGQLLSNGLQNKVVVAGNIGKPVIEVIDQIGKSDYLVLEVSSFQLAFTKLFAPDIAVLLNVSPDHLDWHDTAKNYIAAKAKIFLNQKYNDLAILNYDDKIVKSLNKEIKAEIIGVSKSNQFAEICYNEKGIYINDADNKKQKLLDTADIPLKGYHNILNVSVAVLVALKLKVSHKVIRETIKKYSPERHRLELISKKDKYEIYDDSKATNPHAAIAALNSFARVDILIAGGQDRDANFSELALNIKQKCRHVILIGETSSNLATKLTRLGFNSYTQVESMKAAVFKTKKLLAKYSSSVDSDKKIILLSPGAPSWDMYPSYKARGKEFQKFIQEFVLETGQDGE
ncbi:MAG: UDP-N-acetylmuramoyl-L-alanine--D-glutamate ligase [Bacillota bacterium]